MDEAVFYTRAMRRINRWMIALALSATVFAMVWGGPHEGFAFAVGAAASLLNFRWIHGQVEALGPGGRRPGKLLAAVLILRYPLLAVGGYAIVKIFGLSPIAALTGFFVPVAAVILEILYELVYAGT